MDGFARWLDLDAASPGTIAVANETATILLQQGNWDLAWLAQGGGVTAGSWADIVRSDSATFRTRLPDPTIDQFVKAQARDLDAAKRKQLIAQLQDYLYEAMPFVPGIRGHSPLRFTVRPNKRTEKDVGV